MTVSILLCFDSLLVLLLGHDRSPCYLYYMFCTHRVHFTYFGILLRVGYDLSVCGPVIILFFRIHFGAP